MSKAILGYVTCPHCGNKAATVHEQASRARKLYYRCNENSQTDGCGTIQIPFPAGQRWIKKNLKPLDGGQTEQAAEQAAQDARAEQTKAAAKAARSAEKAAETPAEKPRGFWSALLEDD